MSKKDIREAAEEFTREYNSAGLLPFPVEDVIEYKMGIDIVPMPLLRLEFDMDAYTSCDFTQVTVDVASHNNLGRHRFTLAHEVGHIRLHRKVLETYRFGSIKEWAEFLESMDDAERRNMERQADDFAGFVLMPPKLFGDVLREKTEIVVRLARQCKELGGTSEFIIDAVAKHIAPDISKRFGVSILAATNNIKFASEFKSIIETA